MENNIQRFTNSEMGVSVQVVMLDGEPWFVAKDVCDVLGIRNARDAVSKLDNDEKNTVGITDGIRGNPDRVIVSESGLYHLVFKSRKKSAIKFRRWVTGEVLPSIRKHGLYATENTVENILNDPDTFIDLLQSLKKERAEKAALMKQREKDLPKIEFSEAVMGSKDAISIGEVAKVLNFQDIGRNTLFSILREKDVLMSNNQPYQTFVDRGYFRCIEQKFNKPNGDTCISIKTVVFQKGVDFIRRVLTEAGR